MKKDSTFFIKAQEFNVEEVLPHLITIPAKHLTETFLEIGLSIPRSERVFALKKALREEGLKEKTNEIFNLVKYFEEFPETMLEILYEEVGNKKITKVYLEELWLILIDYLLFRKKYEDALEKLIDISRNKIITDGKTCDTVLTFNKDTSVIFFDEAFNIDGTGYHDFIKIITQVNSETILKRISLKYGVKVQETWKKKEFERIIIENIKQKAIFSKTEEKEELKKLKTSTIDELIAFSDKHKLNLSLNLKLSERVNLLAEKIKEAKPAPEADAKRTLENKKLLDEKKRLDELVKMYEQKFKENASLNDEQLKIKDEMIKTLEQKLTDREDDKPVKDLKMLDTKKTEAQSKIKTTEFTYEDRHNQPAAFLVRLKAIKKTIENFSEEKALYVQEINELREQIKLLTAKTEPLKINSEAISKSKPKLNKPLKITLFVLAGFILTYLLFFFVFGLVLPSVSSKAEVSSFIEGVNKLYFGFFKKIFRV